MIEKGTFLKNPGLTEEPGGRGHLSDVPARPTLGCTRSPEWGCFSGGRPGVQRPWALQTGGWQTALFKISCPKPRTLTLF